MRDGDDLHVVAHDAVDDAVREMQEDEAARACLCTWEAVGSFDNPTGPMLDFLREQLGGLTASLNVPVGCCEEFRTGCLVETKALHECERRALVSPLPMGSSGPDLIQARGPAWQSLRPTPARHRLRVLRDYR